MPLHQPGLERLVNYDSRFFPVRRIQFLSTWVRMPDSHGGAVVRSGCVIGYGIIRRCWAGFKVGPLFADHEQIAGAILTGLSKHVPGGELIFLACAGGEAGRCAAGRAMWDDKGVRNRANVYRATTTD